MDINKILADRLVKNILVMFGVFVALMISAMIFLRIYTRHDSTKEVPDFANLSVDEAEKLASKSGLDVYVYDSVFVRRMAKGAVYRQVPAPGSKVKPGRKVSLVINAVTPKKATMPNVVGYSMRQAKAEILSRGLVLGRLIYVSDEATNNVIRQQRGGKDIRPGKQVNSGTVIDLVVGLSGADCMTTIPKLKGLKNLAAVDVVHESSLNVKRLVFDESVKNFSDSLDAVVYRQSPEASAQPLLMGSEITLYLTVDQEKMPK